MERRLLMTKLGLSGALVPLLTLANSGLASAAPSSALAAYRKGSLTISTISRRASETALQRASNPQVKEFATLELAEQTTLEQVLNNKQNPPLVTLGADDNAALAHLASLPTGTQFDQAYVAAEIGGHQKLLGIQETFIAAEPISSNTVHIAYFMRTFIHEHLYLLSKL